MTEYVVWCEDRGEDRESGRHINAHCSRTAAESWAQRSDAESAEYSIASGRLVEVMVADCEDGDPERFEVSGEAVPQYIATRLSARSAK